MKKFCICLLICALGCDNSSRIDDLDYKIAGRARLIKQLKDPDSLQIIDEKIIRPGRNGGVVGYEATFRAKNSFGGYIESSFYTE